jgi:hypothetical protein
MKKKKSNNSEGNIILKHLFEQRYLFLTILITFTLSTVLFNYFNKDYKENLIEAKTQMIIKSPDTAMFLPFKLTLDKILINYNQPLVNDSERYHFNFSVALSSQNNLIDYLNKEISADYLKILNEHSIDPKIYFVGNNFEITKHPRDLKNSHSFIISMKHPQNFNAIEFLREYVDYHRDRLISQYTKNLEDSISNALIAFPVNNFIQYSNLIQAAKETNCLSEIEKCLENQKKAIEYFNNNQQIEETFNKILLTGVKQLSKNILYEPILEIKTENVKKYNNVIKNLILSSMFSFLLFLAIVLFKDFLRDVLKKS